MLSNKSHNPPQHTNSSPRLRLQDRISPQWKRFDSFRQRFLTLIDKPLYHFFFFFLFVIILTAIVGKTFVGNLNNPTTLTPGQVAPYDVKASHDFTVSTQKTLETIALQDQAAANVLPVFDWQSDVSEAIQHRIVSAFSSAREELARALLTETSTETAPPTTPPPSAPPEAPPVLSTSDILTTIQNAPPKDRLRISSEFKTSLFDSLIGASIPDSAFLVFAEDGFLPPIENTLSTLVTSTLDRAIVSPSSMTSIAAQRGLTLRRFRGESHLISYRVHTFGDQVMQLNGIDPLLANTIDQLPNSNLSPKQRSALIAASKSLIVPNTRFSPNATNDHRKLARQSVSPIVQSTTYHQGQIIVQEGHIVSERTVRTIQTMMRLGSPNTDVLSVIGISIIIITILSALFGFGAWNLASFQIQKRDIVLMSIILLFLALLARVIVTVAASISVNAPSIPETAWFWLIPAAGGAMTIRLILGTDNATLFSFASAALIGLICNLSLFVSVYILIGSLIGSGSVFHLRNRIMIMASAVAIGVSNVIMIFGFSMLHASPFDSALLSQILIGFGGGLFSGFIALSLLPLVEWSFGYTTDIKLLELANLDHPALRELFVKAAGSYHHSLMVGTLAEAAAEAIGCNALLARVGCYYHDIGKSRNPEYFTENQRDIDNPHDELRPIMSAKVIRAHVTDGEKMAREYHLPEIIIDFIKQHHGTKLIGHFFFKAKTEEDPDKPEVFEKDFRYFGPKPQTKEIAICMLADGSEAGTRALKVKTPHSIRERVSYIFDDAWKSGQLDHSALTRKDLSTIFDVMVKLLIDVNHQRVEYDTNKKKDPSSSSKASPSRRSSTR